MFSGSLILVRYLDSIVDTLQEAMRHVTYERCKLMSLIITTTFIGSPRLSLLITTTLVSLLMALLFNFIRDVICSDLHSSGVIDQADTREGHSSPTIHQV